ncbi:PTS beta-glucoside transporter subunit IIBCA [Jutongia huaianensis]|uniref:PTS glucose transporter subunit IIA n=1 Tax=Jutongia huaianensis TaxID=2763668 RepID=A0ABR7N1X1_9FIRM|nr:PTS transporter subunit IIBCA [Jutongia huaianensis]MBC8562620.1 PTS glucose transporter subunit IIA [Jutongia huaianensis]
MDYKKVAQQVLECVGGGENLVSAAHCATRLRMVIADNGKCSKEKLEQIDGVKGVFEASGQLQVIFGTGVVNKVFEEFAPLAGIDVASTKDDVKKAAASKQNWFFRAIKSLGDIFVPIIPAIVASGLLMGLLEGLCNVYPAMAQSSTYTIIHLFSNAAFVFLPILIAISAAKTFGGNIFLGAVIGMIMIHTDLMNAWSVAGATDIPTASVWFGLYDIKLVGYQGHVIPVVIAVWLMSVIEKKLHKIVPEIIDLFVTPLVTVLVTGYVTLTIIGPVFVVVENGVLDGAKWLITLPFGIGAAIAGAAYAPTVVAGVHHMYNALEAGLLSAEGVNTWMPIATAANVAQGAAALALSLKTKNQKTRSVALPASLSAFLGITEPAIFGVNLRYVKPFIAGCIGGAAGGLVAGIMHVGASAYGITGVFGFLITTDCTLGYLLDMVVAAGVAFILSWILYREKSEDPIETVQEIPEAEKNDDTTSVEREGSKQDDKAVYSPLEGKLIPMTEVPDETFASKALGDGVAVIPEKGCVYAPFDGEVEMVYDTGHAIGLVREDGMEVLIHVGINTVELGGKYYTAKVSNGQKIKKGDLLLEFDMDEIAKAGYSLVTPVIVTNSDEYEGLTRKEHGRVEPGDQIITGSC